jgi:hypothetical protein
MFCSSFIVILTGCSRSDLESCETEYDSIIAITNFLKTFYTNWQILQIWPICWAITIMGKVTRAR